MKVLQWKINYKDYKNEQRVWDSQKPTSPL